MLFRSLIDEQRKEIPPVSLEFRPRDDEDRSRGDLRGSSGSSPGIVVRYGNGTKAEADRALDDLLGLRPGIVRVTGVYVKIDFQIASTQHWHDEVGTAGLLPIQRAGLCERGTLILTLGVSEMAFKKRFHSHSRTFGFLLFLLLKTGLITELQDDNRLQNLLPFGSSWQKYFV